MSTKGNVQRRVWRILMLILGCSGLNPPISEHIIATRNFKNDKHGNLWSWVSFTVFYTSQPNRIKYPRIVQLHTFQYSCSLLSFHAILRRHHSAVYHGLQTAQGWKIFLSGSHLLLFAEDECCEINKHYCQFYKSETKSWLFSSFVWLPKTQKHLICNIFTHLHHLKTKF